MMKKNGHFQNLTCFSNTLGAKISQEQKKSEFKEIDGASSERALLIWKIYIRCFRTEECTD